MGPVTIKDLPLSVRSAGAAFFYKVKFHCQLPDLALERGDPGLIFGDPARLGFLVREFAAIELRQPQLDKVGGDGVFPLRIPSADHSRSDTLAALKFERRRMPPAGSSVMT